MPYDAQITRSDAAALIPEEVANDVLGLLPKQSAALSLFRQIRMSTKIRRMPVLSALPLAYFVEGDTGLKQTTDAQWANKYLTAEELAVILPIPDAVLDDASFDVWGEVMPLMVEALGRTVDAAVFFGTNIPASWVTDSGGAVAVLAASRSNSAVRGTHNAAAGGIAEDFNDLFQVVELDGYDVNGIIARTTYKGLLRGARDADGNRIDDVTNASVYGTDVQYPMRGMWPTGTSVVEAIAGDFTQGIMATRQDITYKILDQAVIQDQSGAIVYNLAQQDMVAMRLVMRVGFTVANPINHDNATENTRYPFGVMISPGS